MPAETPVNSLEEIVERVGRFPVEAYLFVNAGLTHTAEQVHGKIQVLDASHHVSGRDLCYGLRTFAWSRWGYLAATVLARWNITCTYDFGRVVYAMIEHELMQKTETDSIEDFRDVFDFPTGMEADYRIEPNFLTAAAAGKKS